MKKIKKLLFLIVFCVCLSNKIFAVNQPVVSETKSTFEKIYEKKKDSIEARGLTFDFQCDLKQLKEKGLQTYVEAFLPRSFTLEKERAKRYKKDNRCDDEIKSDLRKSLSQGWKNICWAMQLRVDLGGKDFIHVVKKANGDIVAFVLFRYCQQVESDSKIRLSFLAVHPDYQGLGLGALLVFSIFEKLPQVEMIKLNTDKNKNDKVIAFYERLGCSRDEQKEGCDVSGDNAYFKLVKRKKIKKRIKIKDQDFCFNFKKSYEEMLKAQDVFVQGLARQTAKKNGWDLPATEKELKNGWKNKCESFSGLSNAYFYSVKNEEQETVAFVLFFVSSALKKAYVVHLLVHPLYRGRGLGKALIFSIFQQNDALETIELMTFEHDKKMQDFCKHIGFEQSYGSIFALERKNCQKNKKHS